MAFGIAVFLLVSLAFAALLTSTPRPFEVGTLLLAFACGTVTALVTGDVFLSACAGALTLCVSLTLQTMFQILAALDVRRGSELETRRADRPSGRASNDERARPVA